MAKQKKMFGQIVHSKPAALGVWRRQEGGFVIRGRVKALGKLHEVRRVLPDCRSVRDASLELARLLEEAKTEPQATHQAPLFRDYAADLFIVATQLNHSRKVVFGKYSYEPPPHDLTCQYNNHVGISEACAASTSLPHCGQLACCRAPQSTQKRAPGALPKPHRTHVATLTVLAARPG